ncbi:hypothetical protein [Solidesulfovibrio alcoholivorans]|uniref:hypothetical protein n=1 Tax=Solidesulfovibrio alcoholivorans TaxID=81406 RepID=UPI000496488B|nr:hypothetical protein [Solidesulfovibrio alcoholivorans]
MSTDLISLNYSSTNTLSTLTGSSTTSSTSASSDSDSTALTISGDEKNFSKGAQTMQKLNDLASSDPEKFKEAAQKISDSLSEAASNSSDSNEAKMYSDMADKFAEAAKSGNMSSLKPSQPPSGTGAQSAAAQAYGNTAQQSSGSNPMEKMDSIISSALSGISASEA